MRRGAVGASRGGKDSRLCLARRIDSYIPRWCRSFFACRFAAGVNCDCSALAPYLEFHRDHISHPSLRSVCTRFVSLLNTSATNDQFWPYLSTRPFSATSSLSLQSIVRSRTSALLGASGGLDGKVWAGEMCTPSAGVKSSVHQPQSSSIQHEAFKHILDPALASAKGTLVCRFSGGCRFDTSCHSSWVPHLRF